MKVYAPWDWVATDWGIQEISHSPDCAVAALPVGFNLPHMFCYRAELANLDLSKFDLVILSDIEFESMSTILDWIKQTGINNYVLALGGKIDGEKIDSSRMVYRPWWCYNLLKYNTYETDRLDKKLYMFDALLGARRPHRDYVMLSLQQHGLLESNIVTYRDIFTTGGFTNHQSEEFAQIFDQQTLQYPYVSTNLNPDWEVGHNIDKSISPYVPWKIYSRTWYSIVAETIGTGNCFFLSEKTTKCLFAGRLFVMFSNANFLQGLRSLGFETFGSVIDESYDSNCLDFERFHMASQQVIYLTQQDPVKIHKKLQPIFEHNCNRLVQLQQQTSQQQRQLLLQHLPGSYIIH
jgi:hypothetical protein